MKRILHVTDVYRPRIGGIELFVEELATRQAAAGDSVAVLTSTRDEPDPQATDRYVVPVVRRGVDLSGFDVVHAHLSVVSPMTTVAIRAASRAGVPVVVTVHSMWTGWLAVARVVAALAEWHRRPLLWTAVSTAVADGVRQVLRDARIRVVPNAVDVDWWREPVQRVPDPEGPVTVLAVGRLAPRKRPMALLRTFEAVRDALPDVPVRLVVAGAGSLEQRMRHGIQQHRLGAAVTLAGALPRSGIRDLSRSADLFVAPALRESFGIAALEARCVGLPVVAMNTGGVGEFITDGVDGVLCDNDRAMVAALTELVGDRARLTAMAAHNRQVAPAHGWPDTLAGFEAAYAEAEALSAASRRRSRRVVTGLPSRVG